ncbi:MAG: cytochrome c biogenesis protein [Desulfurococcales archaeon]|nr:cytochrome c biogenesis protein [Desulfurococcales archaeon]
MDKFSRITIIFITVLLAADMVTAVYAIFKGPFPVTVPLGTPIAYRNIYLHVPIAVSTYLLFAGAALTGLLYMIKGGSSVLRYLDAFITVGLFFAVATLLSGILWASESWGAPWNWDPKETAVLLLAIAYAAYHPLKTSIADPERRGRIAAAYALAAFTMVPMSYAASNLFQSLHPTGEAVSEFSAGGIGGLLLLTRVAIIPLLALTLALTAGRGESADWRIAAIYAIAGLAVAAYALTLCGGDRVLEVVTSEDGMISSMIVSTGRTYTFNPPVMNPIDPPLTEDGVSTLINHIVRVDDGRILVSLHWSTPLNLVIHVTAISLSLALAWRGVGRVED